MNLSKLGMVALSASAIFMATSCQNAKKLSYDKALEWVAEHYKNEGSFTCKIIEKIDFSATKGKEARAAVKEMFSLKEDLKNEFTISEEGAMPYLNATEFSNEYSTYKDFDGAAFYVSGGSLKVTITANGEQQGMKGKMLIENKYDNKGACLHNIMKFVNTQIEGVDGKINGKTSLIYENIKH